MWTSRTQLGWVLAATILLGACGEALDPAGMTPAPGEGKGDEPTTRRDQASFEDFLASVEQEPGGPFIVEGDVPIWGEEALRAYFDEQVELSSGLTVMQLDRVDAIWSTSQRHNLTYCVSDDFGERKGEVIAAVEEAAAEWEAVADVDFVYLPEHDGRCTTRSAQVLFPVLPSTGYVSYIASAFFPNYEDEKRRLAVNFSAHDNMLEKPEYAEVGYSLQGIMRHELGHVLGFRHEHIREDSDASWWCRREKGKFRPITEYDAKSVMHYPQCNGQNDWSLPMTEIDARGAAFFYPDFEAYEAARCEVELRADGRLNPDCEPVVHQLLELANTASLEVLDEWVGLDRRAAEQMVELQRRDPFNTLAELEAITYFADVGIAKMYRYLYETGRCPQELSEEGLVDLACRPVTNRIVELANDADLATLDEDVRLDRRAAANLVNIRQYRPFTSIAELMEVDWVKSGALRKMYAYLYE